VRPPAPEASAIAVASAIVHRMAQPMYFNRRQVAVSASVGLAFVADANSSSEVLVRNADVALSAAKHNGRGCSKVHEPGQRHIATARRNRSCEDLTS